MESTALVNHFLFVNWLILKVNAGGVLLSDILYACVF